MNEYFFIDGKMFTINFFIVCRNDRWNSFKQKLVCFGIKRHMYIPELLQSKYSGPHTLFSKMCRYVHPWVVDAHIEAHHLHVRDRPQASRILQASTALTCTLSYLFVHKGSSQLYIALRCHYIIKVSTLISLSFSE